MSFISKDLFEIRHSLTPNENSNSFFEVDELIAPIIALLNRKGYKTEYSCAGHPYYDEDCDIMWLDSYIKFAPGIILRSHPKNAFTGISNYYPDSMFRVTLSHIETLDNDIKNCYDVYRKILKTMETWYQWAESLPNFEDICIPTAIEELRRGILNV